MIHGCKGGCCRLGLEEGVEKRKFLPAEKEDED